jgi:hypothetical protein
MAARNGPSTDIISQVAASGVQKVKILLYVNIFYSLR